MSAPIHREIGEKIALAITGIMRNDATHYNLVMADLRKDGWTEEDIMAAFMEIGRIVFQEKQPK